MRYTVSINELAENDIREAFLDYNKKLDGLGDDFKAEIDSGIKYLKRDAQTIQVRYGNIRIYFLNRFPFGIHFLMTENEVHVVAVYAMKDDTSKWKK